jgi:hypothetical protein
MRESMESIKNEPTKPRKDNAKDLEMLLRQFQMLQALFPLHVYLNAITNEYKLTWGFFFNGRLYDFTTVVQICRRLGRVKNL